MRMLVTPMRQRGAKRDKHNVQSAGPVRGDLIIGQENSQELGRHTDVARFHTTGPPTSSRYRCCLTFGFRIWSLLGLCSVVSKSSPA